MANQSAAENRRPAGQSDGSDNLFAIVATARAFPAAVASLVAQLTAPLTMKFKLRHALWLVVILLSIECVLWCRSNVATIRSSSEFQAVREIAQSYGMAVPSDFEAVLLRTDPGPNRGTTKTYRVSTGFGAEASIAISSFLWFGWQEHRFNRIMAIQ
jgi:hypothetical protein